MSGWGPRVYKPVAVSVPFDNTTNGFTADDVQAAIEEAKNNVFMILTHTRNAAGYGLKTYNVGSGQQIDLGPLVVVDNKGDVVLKGM
jgi:hypothetical protein